MKIVNYLSIVLISLIVASCSKVADPVKKIGLGNRDISYQADEKVDSLVIPPDLTAPDSQGAFTEVEEILDDKVNYSPTMDEMGWALMACVRFGREECTKLLILRGAPVVAKVSIDFAKLFE